MIPVVRFFNSIAYDYVKHQVLPWMYEELERYDSAPVALEKLVGVIEAWCSRYEKKNLE